MSNILVVDDEPAVLEVVVAVLRRAKYDVLTAVTADEAREQITLHKGEIDLLIVNHTLASQAGRNLVEELLLLRPHMQILRFSGHLEKELRERGEMRPESFFIQKPFLPKQLVDKVRDIIGPAS
jgi:two-component system, cell cycle sensor histidine kinase and response regulator CckA